MNIAFALVGSKEKPTFNCRRMNGLGLKPFVACHQARPFRVVAWGCLAAKLLNTMGLRSIPAQAVDETDRGGEDKIATGFRGRPGDAIADAIAIFVVVLSMA